ncbi:hypothetical protein LTR95_006792 [Oleoguttula sp. CCFEE 5521]
MGTPAELRGVKRKADTETFDAQSNVASVSTEVSDNTTPPASTADKEGDLNDAPLDSDEGIDDSDDETDDVKASYYTEANELWPTEIIYDAKTPQLIGNLCEVAAHVVETFTSYKAQVKPGEGHVVRAQEFTHIPETTKLKIAILGNAGTGKSSLLNSITDCPGLARSLSGGESCTCVPTEYSGASPNQEAQIVAVVEYIAIDKIEGQLDEMFRDYYLFTFEKDRNWDEDTRQSYSLNAQSAIRTLCTLFCDLSDFKNIMVAKAFLAKTYKENGTQELVHGLIARCKEKLQSKMTEEHGCADVCNAATTHELRAMIDPLTASSTQSGVPGLWPLAQRVRLYVKGSRVLDRVTLVDLPGISDTNQARVDITQEYIKTCDYLWATADVARVADDRTVFQLLSRYALPFEGKVWVIPTHTDEGIVGHEMAMTNYLETEGCDLEAANHLHDLHTAKKIECRKLSRSIYGKKKTKRKTHIQRDALQRLEADLCRKRAEAARLEQQRVAMLVEARNELNTVKLKENLRHLMPEGQELVVHCVSNYHYLAYQGAKLRGSKLMVEQTGIPGLRASVLELPAPELLRTLEAFMFQSFPSMLHDILMWLNQTTVEGAPRLLELVQKPQHGLKTRTDERVKAFSRETKKLISSALQDVLSSATEMAMKKMKDIAMKHASTIRAFIRKDGKHSTKMCPKESWNELFSTTLSEIAQKQWPLLVDAQQSLCEKLESDIVKDMTEVSTGVKAWPMESPTKHKLCRAIDLQAVAVTKAFVDNRIAYKKNIRNILIDITQDSHESFFAAITKPVYNACNGDGGAGVTKRSLDRLTAHLQQEGDASPFVRMEAAIAKRLEHDDSANVRKLSKDITSIFRKAHKAVGDLVTTKRQEDPAETAMRKAVVLVWSTWDNKVKEVQAEYQMVKAKYEGEPKAEPKAETALKGELYVSRMGH